MAADPLIPGRQNQMTLKLWTAADTAILTKSFAGVIRSFRPNVPAHQFIAWKENDEPPAPEPGGIVLVCGTKPLESLRRVGLAPKNRTVNSLRETPLKAPGGGWYLVTFDPHVINSEPDKQDMLDWD